MKPGPRFVDAGRRYKYVAGVMSTTSPKALEQDEVLGWIELAQNLYLKLQHTNLVMPFTFMHLIAQTS